MSLPAPVLVSVSAPLLAVTLSDVVLVRSPPLTARSPLKVVVAAVTVNALLANAMLGSVAPASNVQVKPDPAPKVVVPISVVSRLSVNVSPDRAVSIPLVPPWTLTVSPVVMVPVPVSPAVLKIVPLRSDASSALLIKFVPSPRR